LNQFFESLYAHKQSALCLQMAARCATYWLPVMMKLGIMPVWASRYKVSSTTTAQDGLVSDSEDEHDNRSDASELDVDNILDFE
jgi:hypothetical protein